MDDKEKAREAARIERERIRNEQKNKRLSGALRSNLMRRKTQARARREDEEDGRSGLPAGVSDEKE